ncbi:YggS family pyridoxal phosphate-dependent enzyme [Gilvimarinus algae]|uniref:Pyridoxal phosphate homeostasis protein n=1 Tax=Gilvimarinus algae TaxID=3058037 RepID=A0ABT8TKK2_9GAMM|nr:YggS family pyridoxal phosphate-dependent enzyme [Gilvimarinus sp. SDUM040014]MDO3383171.1 YggS family pyridoxal phosphate-dependent enzyme [Gilvimarinus sp. SDUM040014]
MHKIDEKLADVTARLQAAAAAASRPDGDITLIAVSKTQSPERVREAYSAGLRRFGENYLQEALDKQHALADLAGIEWHFIGPIQSNKTRAIAEHFSWVHSVDRLKIAERLSAQRPQHLPPLNICLQVNIDREPSKAGVHLAELPALARAVAALPGLSLRGLMAIPAPASEPEAQRQPFNQLAEALKQLKPLGLAAPLDTLSMGMSADLEAAVECGATMVRIGTDLFGPRQSKATSATNTTATTTKDNP